MLLQIFLGAISEKSSQNIFPFFLLGEAQSIVACSNSLNLIINI